MASVGYTWYSTDKLEQYRPCPCRADMVADHTGTKRVDRYDTKNNNNKYNIQHQLGTRAVLGSLHISVSLIFKTNDEVGITISNCQGRKPGLWGDMQIHKVTKLEKWVLSSNSGPSLTPILPQYTISCDNKWSEKAMQMFPWHSLNHWLRARLESGKDAGGLNREPVLKKLKPGERDSQKSNTVRL